ncbi:Hypothetical protein EAG7_01531 [Klebsiella aerogenes]|nr:Hypothetical protein EAG7_01531 [Klebsiella aerogenes]CCG29990.1 hypothetical protein [Klebsiella aerogenes EA1509E]
MSFKISHRQLPHKNVCIEVDESAKKILPIKMKKIAQS